jgi:hypothetical protein
MVVSESVAEQNQEASFPLLTCSFAQAGWYSGQYNSGSFAFSESIFCNSIALSSSLLGSNDYFFKVVVQDSGQSVTSSKFSTTFATPAVSRSSSAFTISVTLPSTFPRVTSYKLLYTTCYTSGGSWCDSEVTYGTYSTTSSALGSTVTVTALKTSFPSNRQSYYFSWKAEYGDNSCARGWVTSSGSSYLTFSRRLSDDENLGVGVPGSPPLQSLDSAAEQPAALHSSGSTGAEAVGAEGASVVVRSVVADALDPTSPTGSKADERPYVVVVSDRQGDAVPGAEAPTPFGPSR